MESAATRLPGATIPSSGGELGRGSGSRIDIDWVLVPEQIEKMPRAGTTAPKTGCPQVVASAVRLGTRLLQ